MNLCVPARSTAGWSGGLGPHSTDGETGPEMGETPPGSSSLPDSGLPLRPPRIAPRGRHYLQEQSQHQGHPPPGRRGKNL